MESNDWGENSFSNNPWSVDDASAFLKFCCPECDFQIPDLQMFSDHALQNHVKSVAIFGTGKNSEQILIKKEHVEYEADNYFYSSGDVDFSYNNVSIKEEYVDFMEDEAYNQENVNGSHKEKKTKSVVKTKSKPKFKDDIETTCDLCFLSFDSPESLTSHKEVHQDGKFKVCMHCDYKSKDWVQVKYHIDRIHPEHSEKEHFCEICAKGFIYKGTLKLHTRKSHSGNEEGQRVCHECGFSAKSKSGYFNHMKSKHGADKHKKCPHCTFHTHTLGRIQIHIDGKHADLYEKNFDCDHCSRRFIFKTSLKTHLSKLQVRKQLTCKYCSYQVMKIQELEDHVLAIHPETRMEVLVENPPTFTTQELSIDNKAKPKPLCEYCNTEFIDIDTRNKHRDSDHKDGKFKLCTYCGYKTQKWSNLRLHIESNHPENGEKKYLCDICGKGFIFEVSRNVHKDQLHQKVQCKFCPYTANSKGTLRGHIQAKHKVENHKQCPYCEYHTPKIHLIEIHIDSKHPEHDKKQFSCDHCSRHFIFENSLKNHMDTIRNGPKYLARKKMKKDDKLSLL